jgi:hypothetical protein
MVIAKIAILAGVLITVFGTTLPAVISHSVGITTFAATEANPVAIAFGLCLLLGGLVAHVYERDKDPG